MCIFLNGEDTITGNMITVVHGFKLVGTLVVFEQPSAVGDGPDPMTGILIACSSIIYAEVVLILAVLMETQG